jgi:hypothetical protein
LNKKKDKKKDPSSFPQEGGNKVIGAINNDLKEFLSRLPKVFRVMWHMFGGGGGNLN